MINIRSDAQKRADRKFKAAHTVRVPLELNRNTDADILQKLEDVGNKAGYIKKLIREDLKKE